MIVVEHDEGTMRAADHLRRPRAGRRGARWARDLAGDPKQVEKDPASLTGQYLAGKRRIEIPDERRKAAGELLDSRRPASTT